MEFMTSELFYRGGASSKGLQATVLSSMTMIDGCNRIAQGEEGSYVGHTFKALYEYGQSALQSLVLFVVNMVKLYFDIALVVLSAGCSKKLRQNCISTVGRLTGDMMGLIISIVGIFHSRIAIEVSTGMLGYAVYKGFNPLFTGSLLSIASNHCRTWVFPVLDYLLEELGPLEGPIPEEIRSLREILEDPDIESRRSDFLAWVDQVRTRLFCLDQPRHMMIFRNYERWVAPVLAFVETGGASMSNETREKIVILRQIMHLMGRDPYPDQQAHVRERVTHLAELVAPVLYSAMPLELSNWLGVNLVQNALTNRIMGYLQIPQVQQEVGNGSD